MILSEDYMYVAFGKDLPSLVYVAAFSVNRMLYLYCVILTSKRMFISMFVCFPFWF